MKYILTLGIFFTTILPLPAFADYTAATTSVKAQMPIPATCVGSSCQYISAYNSYVHTLNEVNALAREAQSYPQVLQSHYPTVMTQIADILQKSQGLNYETQNIESQLSAVWKEYKPGTPLGVLNGVLEQNTASGIVATLKAAHVIDASDNDTSMSGAIAAIRQAAGHAVTPTQASQLSVQMLTLIWEQLSKERQLTGLRLSEAAQYDMQHVASERQQRLHDEAVIKQMNAAVDSRPPSFTPAQLHAIFSLQGVP